MDNSQKQVITIASDFGMVLQVAALEDSTIVKVWQCGPEGAVSTSFSLSHEELENLYTAIGLVMTERAESTRSARVRV